MTIKRHDVTPRLAQAVVHGNVVYLAGQVPNDAAAGIAEQTRQVLAKIDGLLAKCGTDKSKLLAAQVWITDMRYFDEMNGVWNAWTAPGSAPARACVQASLANPGYKVEIMVTAAVD
jgi:enamine deaminase RidA (YjgF/YER057c/UK114 family)